MKVLHILNDAGTGGAQTLVAALGHQLRANVDTHILVLMDEGPLSPRFADAALSVTYLGIPRKSLNIVQAVLRARKIIQALHPDVVHTHLLQSDLIGALATIGMKTPVVSTIHTTGMTVSDPVRSRAIARVLGSVSAWRNAALVACGPGAYEYMAARGYPLARTRVIVNGVRIPADAGARRRQHTVLSLARWHPMKDHRTLFGALSIVAEGREIPVTIICAGAGTDSTNAVMLSLAEQHGLSESTELLGALSDVSDLMSRADLLVLSSAYGEALPMAGLEALASGVPVVSTRVGDCSSLLVREQYGASPSDMQDLARAIRAALDAPQGKFEEDQLNARRLASANFDIATTAREYLTLYEDASHCDRGSRVRDH